MNGRVDRRTIWRIGEIDEVPDRLAELRQSSGPVAWLKGTNHSPAVIAFLRRARRALPGDPEFGDPLSAYGVGGPRAAASAADRLLDREAASREVSLGALQVWQALTERVSGKPANREATIVFTDLVGLLVVVAEFRRRCHAQTPSPRLAGGRATAVGGGRPDRQANGRRHHGGVLPAGHGGAAAIEAREAVKSVDVDGYTPRMRVGIHTGRPQRIGSDWLGIDVNIAARVMERATRGELVVSQATLDGSPRKTSNRSAWRPNGFAGRSLRPSRTACQPISSCTG